MGDTIGANLRRTAARVPGHEAMVDVPSSRRWTYAELATDVDRLASAFLGGGVEPGDRVGIWAPNCPEWTLVQYATASIGAILVNINPAYRTHELEFVLNQSGARHLVAASAFKTSDYEAMVGEVRPGCPGLNEVTIIGSDGWDRLVGVTADVAHLADVAARLSADDPINIQYTSGTTGFPKGATLSHHNILNNGFFVGELCDYTDADRVCIPVPFYHCFGMTMGNLGCTTHGATMVIPARGFDPAATLAAVAREHCTSLYGVPTMFIAELAEPGFDGYDLTSLRTGSKVQMRERRRSSSRGRPRGLRLLEPRARHQSASGRRDTRRCPWPPGRTRRGGRAGRQRGRRPSRGQPIGAGSGAPGASGRPRTG